MKYIMPWYWVSGIILEKWVLLKPSWVIGGIDSAVTQALAVAALGKENVRAILMPSQYSSSHSVTDAEQLSKNLGNPYDIVPIKNIYESFLQN